MSRPWPRPYHRHAASRVLAALEGEGVATARLLAACEAVKVRQPGEPRPNTRTAEGYREWRKLSIDLLAFIQPAIEAGLDAVPCLDEFDPSKALPYPVAAARMQAIAEEVIGRRSRKQLDRRWLAFGCRIQQNLMRATTSEEADIVVAPYSNDDWYPYGTWAQNLRAQWKPACSN